MADSDAMIHVRLPKELMKEVDHLGVDWEGFRSDTIERLLKLGVGVVRVAQSKDAKPEELIAAPPR